MNILRTRIPRLLAMAACLVGCAIHAGRAPERVERVPAGQYQVVVSESRAGNREYSAILFNLATPGVTLDLATAASGGAATPEDYAAFFQPGFVVYEIREESGAALAYLVVSPRARVMVWSRPGAQGGPVVSVTDLSGAPEASGGAGGAGGGM